jgi:hypothetical protein
MWFVLEVHIYVEASERAFTVMSSKYYLGTLEPGHEDDWPIELEAECRETQENEAPKSAV